MGIKTAIAKYVLLPEILPRIVNFFKDGFSYTAYLIAIIYSNVRLLPPNHPYLNPDNIGRYGIRHVIGEAANKLVFKRNNIDQIFVFFTLLLGLVLLILQFFLLALAILTMNPALAVDIDSSLEMFKNPSNYGALGPEQDIAFILLDRIFGTEGIYNSCVAVGGCTTLEGSVITVQNVNGSYPWPFHLALHKMLAFYSSSLFVVGALVIIYFITTIVMETSKTGQPFGQRVNKAWAPIRLILFFALLIPINAGERNEGLNSAQIITFWVAKFGSNFATNSWVQFNRSSINGPNGTPTNSYLTQEQSMVAEPKAPLPDLYPLLQFIYVAKTCQSAYHLASDPSQPKSVDNVKEINAYIVRNVPVSFLSDLGIAGDEAANNSKPLENLSFDAALRFSAYGNLTIRIGQKAEVEAGGNVKPEFEDYKNQRGFVMPHCGDLTLPINATKEPGANKIQEEYYQLIIDMWRDQEISAYAECTVKRAGFFGQESGDGPRCQEIHTNAFSQNLMNTYGPRLSMAVEESVEEQRNAGDSALTQELIKRGWGGGAIWYNKIATMNGALTGAVMNFPRSSQLPMIMEIAQRSNRSQNENVTMNDQFSQDLADIAGINVLLPLSSKDRLLLAPMKSAFDFWTKEADGQSPFTAPSDNIVTDFINGLFGTHGLFEMRDNTNVHPVAQLTALGKSLMETATRNFLLASGLMLGKNLIGKTSQLAAGVANAMDSFFFTLVSATIAIGVLLYYVLPFLPFLYFIFAVGSWVKTIFEAIVAMPLWALAHLSIDGQGLPGSRASSGYFLLFEIFIRPILILFGLLASITIFAALVNVLNQIFDLIVSNVAGNNMAMENDILAGNGPPGLFSKLGFTTSAIDEFAYTAMYVVICYSLGLASFKLIDQIPGQLLRYMGSSVSSFQDQGGDSAASNLSGRIFQGTELLNNQITGLRRGDLALILSGGK